MNKKYFIKIFIVALIFTMVISITTVFAANTTYSPSEKVYMCDDADLLTDSEEMSLRKMAEKYVKDFNLNVLFLTTNNTDGKSTMVYSDDYMDALFPVGVEDNIAFVIDMDNREIYINTMGIAIERMSDNEIESALDRGYKYITKYDYYNTMSAMVSYSLDNIINNKTTSDSNASFMRMIVSGPSLVIAAIVTGFVVIILISKHHAANRAQPATKYLSRENYKVINKDEMFVRTYDTVQRNYYKPKSSSGGGRSGSSHRSSSGRSHGGGGRKF